MRRDKWVAPAQPGTLVKQQLPTGSFAERDQKKPVLTKST
jgi:hypothetical protein